MRRADILAHRGLWRAPSERNTRAALLAALAQGFGIETDLRDLAGELVIAHDPPVPGALPVAEILRAAAEPHCTGVLALNIKADGLHRMLQPELHAAGLKPERYFVFDMSVPDGRAYLAAGMPVYSRQSDLEPHPAYAGRDAGIWLDDFGGSGFDQVGMAAALLQQGHRLAFVSPELHERPHLPVWGALRSAGAAACGGFALCTDFPEEAASFFGVTA